MLFWAIVFLVLGLLVSLFGYVDLMGAFIGLSQILILCAIVWTMFKIVRFIRRR